MAGEMFGAPAGLMLGEQQNDARMLAAFKGAGAFADLLAQPAKMAQMAAATRLHSAEAGLKEQELGVNQRVAEAMARMGGGGTGGSTPPDPASLMESLGTTILGAGGVKQGADLLSRATQIRQREAATVRAQAQADLATTRQIHAEAVRLGGLFGAVTDQPSWNRARMIAASEGAEMEGLPEIYDPALVQLIVKGSITAAEQQRAKIQQLEYDLHKVNSDEQKDLRATQKTLNQARTKYIERREALLGKQGSGSGIVGSPSQADVSAAKTLIKKEFPNLDDKDLAARNIAARARQIVKNNKGIDSLDQALYMAYNEAKAAGDFQTAGGVNLPLVGKVGQSQKYVGAGRTPATAIPAPPQPADRVVGKHYFNPLTGKVAIWRKGGWELVPGAVGPIDQSALDDEEDEDK